MKEGLPISTKPGKVKSTQNYSVHPARTEKCSFSFHAGNHLCSRGTHHCKHTGNCSIVGHGAQYVSLSSTDKPSPIPVNHTENLISVSAVRQTDIKNRKRAYRKKHCFLRKWMYSALQKYISRNRGFSFVGVIRISHTFSIQAWEANGYQASSIDAHVDAAWPACVHWCQSVNPAAMWDQEVLTP